jgi:hypothetical protein
MVGGLINLVGSFSRSLISAHYFLSTSNQLAFILTEWRPISKRSLLLLVVLLILLKSIQNED